MKLRRAISPTGRVYYPRETAGPESFEAAKRSGFRGWFYMPQLEPDRQLDSPTRREIARKANWLYNNLGIARSIINRCARYEAGTGIWPKSISADKEWARQVTNLFHDRVRNAEYVDARGVENFYSEQVCILRHRRLYGDHFVQFLRSAAGGAMFHNVPGYAVDNANTDLDQSQWVQGVRTNAIGRPLQYRVLTPSVPDGFTDISASEMRHIHGHLWAGQTRGESVLAAAIRHLFDIDDILRFAKGGMKLREQLGYVLETKDEGGGGPRLKMPGETATEEIDTPSGGTLTIKKIFSGEGSIIPELPAGASIKTVESGRNTASFTGFIDYFLRDVAWGVDYPAEFVWFLAGVGGAPMRFILEDVQTTISDVRENCIIPQFCDPFYRAAIWSYREAGLIERMPSDWWRVRWIQPRRITADKARDGKLDDSRLDTGKMAPSEYHGQYGFDDEDVEDEVIDAYQRRAAKCAKAGLSMRDVFPPPAGSSRPAEEAAEPTKEPEDPDEP